MRTRSGTRGARLRFAGAPGVLFIVGALLLPPGAGAHGGAVGHPEGHAGIGVSHGPGVLPSPIAELGNIALANGTFRTGNTSGPNGVGPTALAYDGIHHRLFVGVAGPAPGVIVIDPQTGDEVARWPVPGGSNAVPRALVFDPLNDLLDVAGGGSGNVSFLNAVTGAVENTTYLGVGTDPVALAVDTGTNVLAVAEASDASVALLNATSGSVTRVVAVGPTPDAVAFDPVLGWMIVANGGGSTVTLLDPGNGSTAGSEPVGNAPDGVAYDSVQGNVLVANRLSDNVTILSPGGLVPIGQYGTGRGPGLLSCTIDGQAVIPNTLDDNVTVVDDAHRTPLPSQPTGVDPVVSLWDASEGRDYIADQVTDNLTVLNLTVTGVEGSNGLGGRPLGIADLPGLGRFAFADPGTSAVEEVTAGNLSEVFRTTLPAPPIALAASEALGRLFAIEPQGASAPGNLSILDAGTGAVLGTYPVGLDPQGVAFDPATGEVYVAEWGSASVSVIDPLTGHVNATFSIPAGTAHPSAIAVAVSANGSELYVPAGTSNSTVTVLNATTGAFVAAVPTPSDPVGVADDPTNRTVWVADAGAAEVTEIAESGHVAMANFTLGVDPVGVAVDDPLQWVLVTSPSGHLVDLLNASDGTILGVLRVGAAPTGVAVDPTSVHAAVTDPSGGDVALLGAPPPTFPVTFQESGLPDPSAGWNLTVDGVPLVVTAASVTLPEPNGTHAFSVAPLPGLFPTPASGSVQVDGQSLYVAIAFGPPTYNATFFESGLPAGTLWSVGIDRQVVSSTTTEVLVLLPNGTYPYEAYSSSSFTTTGGTGNGSVTIRGGPSVPALVRFSSVAPFELNFTETGLPSGTSWTVDLGSASASGTTPTLGFRVDYGPYTYVIPAVDGYVARTPRGSVDVTSPSPPPVIVPFVPATGPEYPVSFEPLGLPEGLAFTVVLNGTSSSGTGAVNFSIANGTWTFAVDAPPGWSADPSGGSIVVAGNPVVRIISFRPAATTTTGLDPRLELGVAGAAAAGALIAGAIVVWRRRRPPPVYRVTGELVRSGGPRGARPPPEDAEGSGGPVPVEGTFHDPEG